MLEDFLADLVMGAFVIALLAWVTYRIFYPKRWF